MKKTPQELLKKADLIYSKVEVDAAITLLATQISHDLHDKAPLVMTIMNGGLYFAGQLLPQLSFALETDYLQA
ncbi:MAG: hypoxanthine-guanine phosphoribosyltransferase, partial [Methylophilaceae bacterium]|nr:hypoxanthine-guanine phosphoribosyltransferase [Methylophilaceae bacterium]